MMLRPVIRRRHAEFPAEASAEMALVVEAKTCGQILVCIITHHEVIVHVAQ